MPNLEIIQSKGQYVNGQWIQTTGEPLQSINPAYNNILWQGTAATLEDILEASDAAHKQLPAWASTPFEQRADLTRIFAKRVENNRIQLAQLISMETGKPLWEAQTEVTAVIGKINLSIQAYQERTWPKQSEMPEANACLRFKPHGVVVVLGAFNFPAHLSNGHIVPALLAGNTVLYKPSEHTPAVAEFIMDCWHQSGIPAGTIHCLQGGTEVGKALLSQDIQGVYFTGSYQTGLSIHQQFSHQPEVILALEMGGNNPLVIDEINDIDAAVYQTVLSTLITTGQRCTCARRLIIPRSQQGDLFLSRFIQACQSIVIGSFDQTIEPFMGPVINHQQANRLLQDQDYLIESGGNPLLLMSPLRKNTGFLSPGIIDMTEVPNPPDNELFGPLVQVHRYDHFAQAIDQANQTRYGLAAGLLSDHEAHYRQFYAAMRAGLIHWNRPTTGAASSLPFGGVGLSGNHRPSAYFAADYCAYPIASMEQPLLTRPDNLLPGILLESNT